MQQKGGSPTGGARGDLPGFARTYWRHRYTILCYTLIVTMVAAPIFSTQTSMEPLSSHCSPPAYSQQYCQLAR